MKESKRGGPRRGRTVSIADALKEALKTHGVRRGQPANPVFEAWNHAAGPLAPRAVPVRFQNGELLIQVESSAHYQELTQFTGSMLHAKTNELLGDRRVTRVVFKLKR